MSDWRQLELPLEGNVVHLQELESQPDAETVEMAEGLLEMARDGYVHGFAIAALVPGRSVLTSATDSMLNDAFRAIGGIDYLKKRLLDQLEESE